VAAKRVFEGLTVVTVGLILLGNTLGVLPWSVWWTILALWPLLIVSLGVDILGRAVGSTALRVLASVVVIAGLVYGALVGTGQAPAPAFATGAAGQAFSFSEPGAGISHGTARIGAGLATVRLRRGKDITARGVTPFGQPSFAVTRSGTAVDVRIDSSNGRGTFVVPGNGRSFLGVTLPFNPWERVQVDAGVSQVAIDLTQLDIRDLEVNTGVSNTDITFAVPPPVPTMDTSSRPPRTATISGGLSSYVLRVPRELGVELHVDNGLGSVNVPSGWTRVGESSLFSGVWRSEGYDSSASKLQLTVKAGLSSVDVRQY
jgi:hypothetical protein